MNDLIIKQVEFNGAELMAAQDKESGKIYAGVRWVCDGIGLTRGQMNNETIKVKEDIVLSQGARNLVLPTKGGNQEVLCIELTFLPLWLAKISITPKMQEEQPELTERLIEYQLKAKDVLAAAFLPMHSDLPPELKLFQQMFNAMAAQAVEIKQLSQTQEQQSIKLDNIKDIVGLCPTQWRKDGATIVKKIALKHGGYEHMKSVYEEVYKLINERYGVALGVRLANMKKTMTYNGVCKSKVDKLNNLDVIADDKKLVEAFVSILKELAIKYDVTMLA